MKHTTKSEKIFKTIYILFICLCFGLFIFGIIYTMKPAKAADTGNYPIQPNNTARVPYFTDTLIKSYGTNTETGVLSIQTGDGTTSNTVTTMFVAIFNSAPQESIITTIQVAGQNVSGTWGTYNDVYSTVSTTYINTKETWTITFKGETSNIYYFPQFFDIVLTNSNDMRFYNALRSNWMTEAGNAANLINEFQNNTYNQWNNGYNAGTEGTNAESYNQGWYSGYNAGYADGNTEGYNNGYTTGINDNQETIYNNGYNIGYENGYNNGVASNETLGGYLLAIADVPFRIINGLFEFEVMGFNIAQFVYSVITAGLVIAIIKYFI